MMKAFALVAAALVFLTLPSHNAVGAKSNLRIAYVPLSQRNLICILDPDIMENACPFESKERTEGGMRWSPDGTMIAVPQPTGDEWEITVFSADGSRRLPNGRPSPSVVTGSANVGSIPTWSPDSRRVAGIAEGGILIASVTGGSSHVIPLPEGRILTVSWSPDGANFAVSKVDADGKGLTVLAVDAKTEAQKILLHFTDAAAASAILYNLSWSPDGQRIVLAYVPGFPKPVASIQYWVVNVDGGSAKLIGEFQVKGAISTEVSFFSSGQSIALDGYSGKTEEIFITKADGSEMRQLTHSQHGAFRSRPGIDGSLLYIDLDGPSTTMNLIMFNPEDPETSVIKPLLQAVDYEWAPEPGRLPANAVRLTPIPPATPRATPRPTFTPSPRLLLTPIEGPVVGEGTPRGTRGGLYVLVLVGVGMLAVGLLFQRRALRKR